MFAATAVAVVAKSTENATEPDVMTTPLTVTVSTDPAPPPVKVTVPVALTSTGVRSLTTDGINELLIVNRLIVSCEPACVYTNWFCTKVLRPRTICGR